MPIKAETSVGLFVLIAIGIFIYMTLQIGVVRFDRARYNDYTVYFNDVSGLNKKAEVHIAGVKVGWVEDIELAGNGQQVRALIKVLKEYTLHHDAYGIIRQGSLLGTKYVEIVPGDPYVETIKSGGVLMKSSKETASFDVVLSEFQVIARNLHDITDSLKCVMGGDQGTQRLERALDGFTKAVENFSSASRSVDGLVCRNEDALGAIINDLRTFSCDLKNQFPELSQDVRSGIDRMVNQFEKTADPVCQIADKINKGDGVIGKLITDEEMARNARIAVEGLKDYFETIDRLAIIFDSHVESMYGFGNQPNLRDAKGYFNARLHPTEDYFYLLGVMGDYYGQVVRTETVRRWFESECKELLPQDMELDPAERLRYAPIKTKTIRLFDTYLWNVQFGKIYDNLAARVGLFEGTFGLGIDYELPFDTPSFRWVTTFEAFDFYGRNRIDDTRVHLKWLNKLFFTESLYCVFGADDFISETNRNAFFGAGFRFADDEVKYYVSGLCI